MTWWIIDSGERLCHNGISETIHTPTCGFKHDTVQTSANIWDMYVDSRNLVYRQDWLFIFFYSIKSLSERLVIWRPVAHLVIWLPSASLGLPGEQTRPKVTHERAVWSQSSLLIPTTEAYKNFDRRSKDRANCSQNRRDRDSQNLLDVMVFESADNDSWRMAGLPPKHNLSSKKYLSIWGSL